MSGLQHFRKIASPATFRPTECLIGLALFLLCAVEPVYEGPRMRKPPRKHHLGAEQRRALLLLASSPFGVSKAGMSANGFTHRIVVGLIGAGFVTAQRENTKVTNQSVGRIRISDVGRRAIEG